MKKNGKYVFTVIVAIAAAFAAGFFSEKTKNSKKVSLKVNGTEIFGNDGSDSEDSESDGSDSNDYESDGYDSENYESDGFDSDDYGADDFDFDSEFSGSDSEAEDGGSSLWKIVDYAFGSSSGKKNVKVKSDYISTIYITGMISEENRTYNQKWLLRQIKKSGGDPKNAGILLVIDSPGGTVYESDEAYLALKKYKKSTGRPVYAYFGSLAASGGYYIGCAADKIFANRNTLTGSIGVIAGQSVDATELLGKAGIKVTTITAGKNKNMGNYNSVLTDEQRAIFQSIADEAYEQFTGIVAESRKMEISDVKKLADGRVYTALQAKKNGLVDAVCPLEEAKESIKSDFYGKMKNGAKAKQNLEFVEFKYKYEMSFADLLSGVSSFVENPEASIYSVLGKTSSKCLYLYQ